MQGWQKEELKSKKRWAAIGNYIASGLFSWLLYMGDLNGYLVFAGFCLFSQIIATQQGIEYYRLLDFYSKEKASQD